MGKQSTDDTPKSYTGTYGDQYAGIRIKIGREKIVVTKQEFISYITQAMYSHSRQLTVNGIDRLPDGTVIQPKGIADYFIMAGAIAPKRLSGKDSLTLTDGYKVVIGGRLIVVPNASEDRYVYDCGKLSAWTTFFKEVFSLLSAKDVLFVYKLYAECGNPGVSEEEMHENLIVATHKITTEGFCYKPAVSFLPRIAEFFCFNDPEMLVETSYRHMAVQLSEAIKAQQLTDTEISREVRRLITENPDTCQLTMLPLMLVAIFVAEQGRNYTANLANLVLFQIIEQGIEVPGVGKIGWLTALATEKMVELYQQDPKHKKGQRQAEIGGWVTMSHTGSQGETRTVLTETKTKTETKIEKYNFGELPLAQIVGDQHIDMSFIHPSAKMALAIMNHVMSPLQSVNRSLDKTFILLATWLVSSLEPGDVKVLALKSVRQARRNITPEKLADIQKNNKRLLLEFVFPIFIRVLDDYEARGMTNYLALQTWLEDQLRCIRAYGSRNGNAQFVAITSVLCQTPVLTSAQNRELDFAAMLLRHETVDYIRQNKPLFGEHIQIKLGLTESASDDTIESYCQAMGGDGQPGDEITLHIMGLIIKRPIVVIQLNKQQRAVGLVYGIECHATLDLDRAIVLSHDGFGQYNPIEHRGNRDLSLYIQHQGAIIETCDSDYQHVFVAQWWVMKAMRARQRHYLFRMPLGGPVSQLFSDFNMDNFASKNNVEEPDIPESVKQESRLLAQKQGNIGRRHIEGWTLKDVPDIGNCFYHAIIEQMKTINHPFLAKITQGMVPHLFLRNTLNSTSEGSWAEDINIDQFVSKFPVILAIVDTRRPEQGYVCYYRSQTDGAVITNVDPMLPLPINMPILRLAATGDHYLSVMSNPSLVQGSLRASFKAPTLRALEAMLFGRRFARDNPHSVLLTSAAPSLTMERR